MPTTTAIGDETALIFTQADRDLYLDLIKQGFPLHKIIDKLTNSAGRDSHAAMREHLDPTGESMDAINAAWATVKGTTNKADFTGIDPTFLTYLDARRAAATLLRDVFSKSSLACRLTHVNAVWPARQKDRNLYVSGVNTELGELLDTAASTGNKSELEALSCAIDKFLKERWMKLDSGKRSVDDATLTQLITHSKRLKALI